MCNAGQDQIEEVASMEEILSQIGTSPKTPFRLIQLSQWTSIHSLSLKHQWAHWVTPNNWMCYCIHVRVSLREGRDNQPPTFLCMEWISNCWHITKSCPRDLITEAVVLALGEAILFFGSCSCYESLLYRNAQDIEFSLRGHVTWAGRTAQVEATIHTMQEGHRAMVDAIMEKKTKARGHGHPQGLRRATWSSAAACNINDWMQGLDEGVSHKEVRRIDDICACGQKQSGAHAQHFGRGGRWHRWQRTLWALRGSSRGLPSSGGGSSDGGRDWHSLHSTMMRTSRGSNRSAHAGRGLQVKVNLPISKDKKVKDGVTYHSWWWDVAVFHQSGWDDQHLFSYFFCLLRGFPGNLARSLGEDATISNIL